MRSISISKKTVEPWKSKGGKTYYGNTNDKKIDLALWILALWIFSGKKHYYIWINSLPLINN